MKKKRWHGVSGFATEKQAHNDINISLYRHCGQSLWCTGGKGAQEKSGTNGRFVFQVPTGNVGTIRFLLPQRVP
jgi:hypothetical protein